MDANNYPTSVSPPGDAMKPHHTVLIVTGVVVVVVVVAIALLVYYLLISKYCLTLAR
jgi:hypothetical protein